MNDDQHSGIPTQAIHEAYLDMQRALKRYRQAKDQGNQRAVTEAHGDVQEGVLTFFELLRPHVRHETGVSQYWDGKLPPYNGDGTPPQPEDGAAILQVQEKTEVYDVPDEYDEIESLEEWHDALELNGNTRILGLAGRGDKVVAKIQHYQLGLRHMEDWETKYTRTTESIGGFFETKERETVERQRIPIDRLKRAARELSDVADRLELLSDVDSPRQRYHAGGDTNDYPEPYGDAETPE